MATLYEKVGRRYLPVQDTCACAGLTNGSWLVTVDGGSTRMRRLLTPDLATVECALEVARNGMRDAMVAKADKIPEPRTRRMTRRELAAVAAYRDTLGRPDLPLYLRGPALDEILDAGIAAVRNEIEVQLARGTATMQALGKALGVELQVVGRAR